MNETIFSDEKINNVEAILMLFDWNIMLKFHFGRSNRSTREGVSNMPI